MLRDDTASVVADILGVSASYVRMVVNGKRENKTVYYTYQRFKQSKYLIIEEIKKEFMETENLKKNQ